MFYFTTDSRWERSLPPSDGLDRAIHQLGAALVEIRVLVVDALFRASAGGGSESLASFGLHTHISATSIGNDEPSFQAVLRAELIRRKRTGSLSITMPGHGDAATPDVLLCDLHAAADTASSQQGLQEALFGSAIGSDGDVSLKMKAEARHSAASMEQSLLQGPPIILTPSSDLRLDLESMLRNRNYFASLAAGLAKETQVVRMSCTVWNPTQRCPITSQFALMAGAGTQSILLLSRLANSQQVLPLGALCATVASPSAPMQAAVDAMLAQLPSTDYAPMDFRSGLLEGLLGGSPAPESRATSRVPPAAPKPAKPAAQLSATPRTGHHASGYGRPQPHRPQKGGGHQLKRIAIGAGAIRKQQSAPSHHRAGR